MSDPRNIGRRLEQTQVVERPGASGQTTFFSTGTYVPTYLGGTTAGATTYVLQQGAWTKIGDLVFVTASIQWSAATGTGNAQVSLPFTSANVTNQNHSGSLWMQNVTFANGTPQILISPNTAFLLMSSPLTNAAATFVAMEAAGSIIFSAFYHFA